MAPIILSMADAKKRRSMAMDSQSTPEFDGYSPTLKQQIYDAAKS